MSTMPTSDWIRGNVLGLAAIFLALSGTAYATHPGGANTISTGDIINGEVRSGDIGDGEVRAAEVAPDSLGSNKIADGSVKNADLSTGASSSNTIADGGIQGVDVRNETLGGEKLADLAVTIPKLAFDPATQVELNAHKSSADHDDRYWARQGNEGTTAGKEFLGTTDDEPLELRVNAARALRIEPASDGTNVSPNVIGGIADNSVTAGVHSATIGGGGRRTPTQPATANRVTDDYGTIGGGSGNQAGDGDATTSNRRHATVAGGTSNTASGNLATVGGGTSNTASGQDATIGGGGGNTASEFTATVPGGQNNTAGGEYSLAAGRRAKANHDGAFVWADSQFSDIASTADNQFIARASGEFFLQSDSSLDDQGGFLNTSTGGFLSTGGMWTNNSDEDLKRGFAPVEPRAVLAEVANLPVRSWSYEAEPSVRHVGPTAQDFHRAFGLGGDDRHIGSADADGIALAAIKGLNEKVERLQRRLAGLREREGSR